MPTTDPTTEAVHNNQDGASETTAQEAPKLQRRNSFSQSAGDFFDFISEKYKDAVNSAVDFLSSNEGRRMARIVVGVIATVAGTFTGGIAGAGIAAGFMVAEEVLLKIAANRKEKTEEEKAKTASSAHAKTDDSETKSQGKDLVLSEEEKKMVTSALEKWGKSSAADDKTPSGEVSNARVSHLDPEAEKAAQSVKPAGEAKSPKGPMQLNEQHETARAA